MCDREDYPPHDQPDDQVAMCDVPGLPGEAPHARDSRAGCPGCYVPGAEKGD